MPQKTCAVCDGPVSAAGRKSKTGVYYCSKVDCRRERDRLRAQRWRDSVQPEPVRHLPTTVKVVLEIEAKRSERRALEELRAILLDGGLTQEEVDEQFPLPA